jgi:phosphoribosylaminoimidazolecarboxamide formyltransferase/IMP cyclohydrolase
MGWPPIDVVVINLYDFEGETAKPNVTLDHAVENIDIGGPSGLRAAAKNYKRVTVVCNPADYGWVGSKISLQQVTERDRDELMLKVFQHTAGYDNAIAGYLARHAPAP